MIKKKKLQTSYAFANHNGQIWIPLFPLLEYIYHGKEFTQTQKTGAILLFTDGSAAPFSPEDLLTPQQQLSPLPCLISIFQIR